MQSKSTGKRARRLLLCATGAYISYGLPRIILHLLRHVADDVQVALSRDAAKIVSPYAVEVASRNHVFVEMDDCGDGVYVPHIELGRNVELIVALIIAADVPVIFVPVSNPGMIEHPAVQRNIERLRTDGYVVLPPLAGPEVATREGMELLGESFPFPALALQVTAALSNPKSQ